MNAPITINSFTARIESEKYTTRQSCWAVPADRAELNGPNIATISHDRIPMLVLLHRALYNEITGRGYTLANVNNYQIIKTAFSKYFADGLGHGRKKVYRQICEYLADNQIVNGGCRCGDF